jgi:4-hydroxy-tetrahydrodipicolinate reductase
MKIAVLGKGKTGSKVIELLQDEKIPHTVFDSTNTPTIDSLKGHDVIISFLAQEPFESYIESKLPLVCGTTGFKYTDDLKLKIKDQKLKWIVANNFSLGMNLVKSMIQTLGKANLLVSAPEYKIHEVHHTKKLDAPSGTAISFMNWLGHECPITSERIGDVIGFHEITLKTKTEEIKLSHNALDRKIFAEGAVFAAKKILSSSNLNFGITSFQEIIEKELM